VSSHRTPNIVVSASDGNLTGYVKEIKSGSGYWSHDSSVVVMSAPKPIEKIQVTWPDGRKFDVAVAASTTEIVIDYDGAVK